MRTLLLLFLSAGALTAQQGPRVTIAWSQRTNDSTTPATRGYLGSTMPYDSVSGKIFVHAGPAGYDSGQIYSNYAHFYNAATGLWQQLGGLGDNVTYDCVGDATHPSGRHPGQWSIDTRRHRAYLFGGLNTMHCPPVGTSGDIWYLDLNGTPPNIPFTKAMDYAFSTGVANNASFAAVYDPENDVHFIFGANSGNWRQEQVYCEANTDSTIRVLQVAAGCTDTGMNLIADAKGTGGVLCSSDYTKCPVGAYHPSMVYLTSAKKMLVYGGYGGGVNRNETWLYDVASRTYSQVCGVGCTPPPVYQTESVWGQVPLAYDSGRNLVFMHQPTGSGSPADYTYDPTIDRWLKLTTTGGGPSVMSGNSVCQTTGSLNCDTVMGIDPAASKIITLGKDMSEVRTDWVGTITDVGCALSLSPVTVTRATAYSGTLTPSNCETTTSYAISSGSLPPGLSLNTTIGAITGTPTTSGTYSFTATYSTASTPLSITVTPYVTAVGAVRGVGGTTMYYQDRDGDGYGTGKRSDSDYGPAVVVGDTFNYYQPGNQPDADDNDATVHSVADWRAKYGSGASDTSTATLLSFLSASRGYTGITRVAYVDPVNGNDATGDYWDSGTHSAVDAYAHPYQHEAYIGQRLFNDGVGGLLILRGGTYSGMYFGLNGGSFWHPHATAADKRLYIMAYPGEAAIWSNADGMISENFTHLGYGWVTIDGITIMASSPNAGGGISFTDFDGLEIRNCELIGTSQSIWLGNRIRNVLIERNVFHDNYHHSVYLGYAQNGQGLAEADFDFTQAEANYQARAVLCSDGVGLTECLGAAENITVRDNVIYRDGYGGYEPLHLNSYARYIHITGNIIHNTGGTGVGFQTGIYDSDITNNLIFANGLACVTINLYGPDTQAASMRRLGIRNNTCWTGRASDYIRGGYVGGALKMSGSDSTSGNHWLKDITFENNLVMADLSHGAVAFLFGKQTFLDTYTIRNNVVWDMGGGTVLDNVMWISATYPSFSADVWTHYNWAGFLAANSGWTNNVNADPKITAYPASLAVANPEQFNGTLQGTSSAINAAYAASAPATDLRGVTRTAPDIGALEYTGAPTCAITTTSLPGATVGQPYSQTLVQSGCSASTWAGWTTCRGIALDASTGVLSGTVTGSAGSCSGTVTYDTASAALSISISAAPSSTGARSSGSRLSGRR